MCHVLVHMSSRPVSQPRVSSYGWEVPFYRSTAPISKIQESLDPSGPGSSVVTRCQNVLVQSMFVFFLAPQQMAHIIVTW